MKNYLLLLCLFCIGIAYCQTDAQIDSLTVQMCKTLKNNENLTDSIRIHSTYDQHLPGFFRKFPAKNDAEFGAMFDKIFFRYQKNCNLLLEIIKRNTKNKGDFKFITSKPKNVLSKNKCRQAETIKKFYYVTMDGEKTLVTIDKGLWYEEFSDGTFSKLYFRWVSDCEFEIEFIESNNLSRKNFSSKGDTYHYGMYSSEGNDYDIWINDSNGNATQSFKLHAVKQ